MKFDNYDEVEKILSKIVKEKCMFNASVDVYITLSLNSRTKQRAKKQ